MLAIKNLDGKIIKVKKEDYQREVFITRKKDDCDCMTQNCPGCFYPCENCASTKCGIDCKVNRKWTKCTQEISGQIEGGKIHCTFVDDEEDNIIVIDDDDDDTEQTNEVKNLEKTDEAHNDEIQIVDSFKVIKSNKKIKLEQPVMKCNIKEDDDKLTTNTEHLKLDQPENIGEKNTVDNEIEEVLKETNSKVQIQTENSVLELQDNEKDVITLSDSENNDSIIVKQDNVQYLNENEPKNDVVKSDVNQSKIKGVAEFEKIETKTDDVVIEDMAKINLKIDVAQNDEKSVLLVQTNNEKLETSQFSDLEVPKTKSEGVEGPLNQTDTDTKGANVKNDKLTELEEFANGNTEEIVLPKNTVEFNEEYGEHFDTRKNQRNETIGEDGKLQLGVLEQTDNENVKEISFHEKDGEDLKTDKLMEMKDNEGKNVEDARKAEKNTGDTIENINPSVNLKESEHESFDQTQAKNAEIAEFGTNNLTKDN